jgi:hypothetical protein
MIETWMKPILDEVAAGLPLDPPLKPDGDTTIREMLPDLTPEELDYVVSKYTGTMVKG